jgi:hypothetical protein
MIGITHTASNRSNFASDSVPRLIQLVATVTGAFSLPMMVTLKMGGQPPFMHEMALLCIATTIGAATGFASFLPNGSILGNGSLLRKVSSGSAVGLLMGVVVAWLLDLDPLSVATCAGLVIFALLGYLGAWGLSARDDFIARHRRGAPEAWPIRVFFGSGVLSLFAWVALGFAGCIAYVVFDTTQVAKGQKLTAVSARWFNRDNPLSSLNPITNIEKSPWAPVDRKPNQFAQKLIDGQAKILNDFVDTTYLGKTGPSQPSLASASSHGSPLAPPITSLITSPPTATVKNFIDQTGISVKPAGPTPDRTVTERTSDLLAANGIDAEPIAMSLENRRNSYVSDHVSEPMIGNDADHVDTDGDLDRSSALEYATVPELLSALSTNSVEERRAVIAALDRVDPAVDEATAYRKSIAKAYKSLAFDASVPESRAAGVRGMVRWGARYSVPYLIRLLDDSPDPLLAAEIFSALVQLDDPRGVAPTAKMANCVEYRDAAIESLRAMGEMAESSLTAALAADTGE